MTQKFRITTPLTGKTLFRGLKLKRLLFGGSADKLVHRLAVPIRPQRRPFVPAHSQSHRCCSTQTASGDSLQETRVDKRAKREADGEVLADSVQRHKPANFQGTTTTPIFSNLPTEIHRLVFDHIEYIEDVLCLGCTSRYFWALARIDLDGYYMGFLGRWAGENIVCVGEGVEPNDCPPGLFSVGEMDALCQKEAEVWNDDNDDGFFHNISRIQPTTLYHVALPYASLLEDLDDLEAESRRLFRELEKHKDAAFPAICWQILTKTSDYFAWNQPWILRNLTTKEFVRSEAVALKPEYVHGPDIRVLGFGEVVLSRICWSTCSNIGIHDPTNITRGVWAGHRFDITTLARHKDETNGLGWSDVSDEVMGEINAIWSHQYGADLRKELVYWYAKRPYRGFLSDTPL